MSLKTWIEEFYPIEARLAVDDDVQACEHSIRKWMGLRRENLMKHGVVMNVRVVTEVAPESGTDYLDIPDDKTFWINSGSCVLCQRHYNEFADVEDQCETCPLFRSLGYSCDDEQYDEENEISLFNISCRCLPINQNRYPDPEPMIGELEKALAMVKEEKK